MKTEKEQTNHLLASNLRLQRKKKMLTQKELGERIGVSRQIISDYETGKRTPNIFALKTLADIFEVSTDYLIGRIDFENDTFAKNVSEYTGFSESAILKIREMNENRFNNKIDAFTKERNCISLNVVEKLLCTDEGEVFLSKIAQFLESEIALRKGYNDLTVEVKQFLDGEKIGLVSRDGYMNKISGIKKKCQTAENNLFASYNALEDFLIAIQSNHKSISYAKCELENLLMKLRKSPR